MFKVIRTPSAKEQSQLMGACAAAMLAEGWTADMVRAVDTVPKFWREIAKHMDRLTEGSASTH